MYVRCKQHVRRYSANANWLGVRIPATVWVFYFLLYRMYLYQETLMCNKMFSQVDAPCMWGFLTLFSPFAICFCAWVWATPRKCMIIAATEIVSEIAFQDIGYLPLLNSSVQGWGHRFSCWWELVSRLSHEHEEKTRKTGDIVDYGGAEALQLCTVPVNYTSMFPTSTFSTIATTLQDICTVLILVL